MTQNDSIVETKSPSFEVNADIDDQTLRVSLRVGNSLKKPIYLLNRLWEWNEKGDYIEPGYQAFTCFKDNKTLHMVIGMPHLPTGLRTEVRIIPFSTVIKPGEKYVGTLNFPLPVLEYSPYFPAEKQSSYQSEEAVGLEITLHYLKQIENLTVKDAPIEDARYIHHPNLLAEIEKLQSPAVKLMFPVKKRSDAFECL